MDEIFNKQIESNSLNVFYFLISNLSKFINVSDDVKKRIIIKTIKLCIKGEKVTELRSGYRFEENSLLAKINLLHNHKGIFNLLQQAVYEFEDDSLGEKDLIEFYVFYYEMASLNRRMNVTNFLHVKNSKKLKELAYKDLHLFCQAIVPRKSEDKILPTKVLVEQIEHFGTRSLFKDMKFRYRENVTRIDTFDLYLISVIENSDYDGFFKGYYELVKNGLKHQQIIDHIQTTRLYFFHRGESFEKILNLFLKSNDKNIDDILLGLVRRSEEMKNAYDKFKENNKHPKLKIIDKMYKEKLTLPSVERNVF